MMIKVRTMNTTYTIFHLSQKMYIVGHARFCPTPVVCSSIKIEDRMWFQPIGGKGVLTSPVEKVEFLPS